jgi:non-ribosomal peptide synthetase component E (peptide arylation enzyme)
MLSHFSNSRTHDNYSYVAKAIADLPEFSQADQYGSFLK